MRAYSFEHSINLIQSAPLRCRECRTTARVCIEQSDYPIGLGGLERSSHLLKRSCYGGCGTIQIQIINMLSSQKHEYVRELAAAMENPFAKNMPRLVDMMRCERIDVEQGRTMASWRSPETPVRNTNDDFTPAYQMRPLPAWDALDELSPVATSRDDALSLKMLEFARDAMIKRIESMALGTSSKPTVDPVTKPVTKPTAPVQREAENSPRRITWDA